MTINPTIAIRGLALGPLIPIGLLMTLAVVLRFQAGHWSFTLQDNYPGHGIAVFLIIVLTVLLTIPFWMLALFASVNEVSLRERFLQLTTHLTCWFVFAFYCKIDPWNYLDWIRD